MTEFVQRDADDPVAVQAALTQLGELFNGWDLSNADGLAVALRFAASAAATIAASMGQRSIEASGATDQVPEVLEYVIITAVNTFLRYLGEGMNGMADEEGWPQPMRVGMEIHDVEDAGIASPPPSVN